MPYRDQDRRRACQRASARRPEAAPARRAAVRRYTDKRREFLCWVKSQPCRDCGHSFSPECMDFDHVRGVKLFELGRELGKPWEALVAEAMKCEVVCACCHRTRTLRRRRVVCPT